MVSGERQPLSRFCLARSSPRPGGRDEDARSGPDPPIKCRPSRSVLDSTGSTLVKYSGTLNWRILPRTIVRDSSVQLTSRSQKTLT
ncbi:hypothetical protein GWI33_011973 [Rhynchophorus ferrugineus]|uniref:Uncharacterized protein n=1 Tax=Rhynchophorus ferrugineus TaxID=354439 RepID=A0A834IQ21_RHYFE|nr:hypothetical protein GWI33_011973 [Rhynchophorus ferrugineus]